MLSIAKNEDRVVVTKDDDFVQSHLIAGRPERLLLVATGNMGNIGNAELEALLRNNLARIENALHTGRFVEINCHELTTHD